MVVSPAEALAKEGLAVFTPKNKVYASNKGEEDDVTGVGAAIGRLLRRTLVRRVILLSRKSLNLRIIYENLMIHFGKSLFL